jgi:2-phosphoglycerate kinase
MASKYDSVKVKVHIGEHYYIFSRFLLSKILSFCEVPTTTAVRLSLDLKKELVDQQRLDITQEELQRGIFSMMQHHGYGSHIRLYTTMTQFYTQRVPLVVFISGTGCCGKSTVTQMLGSKLSHHNIVNTEVVMDTAFSISCQARSGGANQMPKQDGCQMSDPLWFATRNQQELVELWLQRCEQVAKCIERDIEKTLQEGKVLLVEGTYLNLPLFAKYFTTAAEQRKAIVLAFVLRVPPSARCRLTEQWLESRSHFLPDMSSAQQEEHISASFNLVHATHMASLDAAEMVSSPVVTIIDFLSNDSAATVSRMHTQLLNRIVERLDALPGD